MDKLFLINMSYEMENKTIIISCKSVHKKSYKKVVLGGTFNIIHKGHEQIIKCAFKVGSEIVIGLTTDSFAENMHKSHHVLPYKERITQLTQYLLDNNIVKGVAIVPLNDQYGLAIENTSIDAIVVSRNTLKTAKDINHIRLTKKLKPLDIILVNTVYAEDGKQLSTTRILNNIIDKKGKLKK